MTFSSLGMLAIPLMGLPEEEIKHFMPAAVLFLQASKATTGRMKFSSGTLRTCSTKNFKLNRKFSFCLKYVYNVSKQHKSKQQAKISKTKQNHSENISLQGPIPHHNSQRAGNGIRDFNDFPVILLLMKSSQTQYCAVV